MIDGMGHVAWHVDAAARRSERAAVEKESQQEAFSLTFRAVPNCVAVDVVIATPQADAHAVLDALENVVIDLGVERFEDCYAGVLHISYLVT